MLEPEHGPCKARILRYHYNSSSGKCEVFTYGGCGGNKNNFVRIDECQAVCIRKFCMCLSHAIRIALLYTYFTAETRPTEIPESLPDSIGETYIVYVIGYLCVCLPCD